MNAGSEEYGRPSFQQSQAWDAFAGGIREMMPLYNVLGPLRTIIEADIASAHISESDREQYISGIIAGINHALAMENDNYTEYSLRWESKLTDEANTLATKINKTPNAVRPIIRRGWILGRLAQGYQLDAILISKNSTDAIKSNHLPLFNGARIHLSQPLEQEEFSKNLDQLMEKNGGYRWNTEIQQYQQPSRPDFSQFA